MALHPETLMEVREPKKKKKKEAQKVEQPQSVVVLNGEHQNKDEKEPYCIRQVSHEYRCILLLLRSPRKNSYIFIVLQSYAGPRLPFRRYAVWGSLVGLL
eukprot:gene11007-7650_t